MDTKTPHEKLIVNVRDFSRTAWDHQQVVQRMRKLLPERLRSLKNGHRSGRKAAQAERQALNDENYLNFLNEYLVVYGDAMEARIQYETHMMLLEARKTLRVFRKHGLNTI